jgi:Ala-tRNA(Pro) deacylase
MAIPASIERFLSEHHVNYTPVHHPPAFTAQEEAAATHTPGRAWAKTVVCLADNVPILVVLPADRIVDERQLREVATASAVRLATEREFAELYPGAEVGAMPPLGPLYSQRVYVDEALSRQPEIIFHAGTHTDAVRMRYDDFVSLVQPILGAFSRKQIGRHYGA